MANHFILREKNPYKVVTDFYHLVSIYLYIIFLHLSKMDINKFRNKYAFENGINTRILIRIS
jgi:hypothetical protein